jgi:hypothetical protein
VRVQPPARRHYYYYFFNLNKYSIGAVTFTLSAWSVVRTDLERTSRGKWIVCAVLVGRKHASLSNAAT